MDGQVLRVDACPDCWQPFQDAFAELIDVGQLMKFGINVDALIEEREKAHQHARANDRDRKREKRSPGNQKGVNPPIGQMPITQEPTLDEDETDENGMYPCGYCERTFPNKTARGGHRFRGHGLRSREAKHGCIYCEETFVLPSDVRNHVRRIHAERLDEYNSLPMEQRTRPLEDAA